LVIDQTGIVRYKGAGANITQIKLFINNLLVSKIDDNNSITPDNTILEQNYPNPFNPYTTISFHLPTQENVLLQIFDVKGKLIRNLIDNNMHAGSHELIWDGLNDNGIQVGNGVYFYTLRSGRQTITKKMTLLR